MLFIAPVYKALDERVTFPQNCFLLKGLTIGRYKTVMICRNGQLKGKILGRKSIFNMSKLIHLRLIYFISPLLYSKTTTIFITYTTFSYN